MDYFTKNNYTPYTTYSLNGCMYLFNDLYVSNENIFFRKNSKGNYVQIKPINIFGTYFISVRDINGNNIKIKLK